jgi:vacuolar iron transporter family protein
MSEQPTHFEGKEAIGHLAAAQARGKISASEIHGAETPGYISAGADAGRETCILFLLLLPFLLHFDLFEKAPLYLGVFFLGWILWKIARASWLGWSRLERLHRILEQEKWEIEHNRPQERDELRELYRTKGFQGKLLEEVLDVLMADSGRLLRVMVEEELGLTLENVDHPLKQGFGAGIGSFASVSVLLAAWMFHSPLLIFILALLLVAFYAALIAIFTQNKVAGAIVWNVALAIGASGSTYYTLNILR